MCLEWHPKGATRSTPKLEITHLMCFGVGDDVENGY